MDEINGLPAHPLLVHATVVLLPLAALALVVHVLWPAARRRLGMVTPILALVALLLVPVTTSAGEALAGRLDPSGESAPIRRHEELAEQILPWAIVLALLAVIAWAWWRFDLRNRLIGPALRVPADWVLRVLAVASAVVLTVVLFRAGDAGARATWEGVTG